MSLSTTAPLGRVPYVVSGVASLMAAPLVAHLIAYVLLRGCRAGTNSAWCAWALSHGDLLLGVPILAVAGGAALSVYRQDYAPLRMGWKLMLFWGLGLLLGSLRLGLMSSMPAA